MMKIVVLTLILILLSACAPQVLPLKVAPVVDVPVVNLADNTVSDTAVWANSKYPEDSLILGANLADGLFSYQLSGEMKQRLQVGRLQQVDMRQQVVLRETGIDVIAATNLDSNSINLFYMHNHGVIKVWPEVAVEVSELDQVNGLCMGVVSGELMLVVTGQSAGAEVYQFNEENNVVARTRNLSIPSQSDACEVDDETGDIYLADKTTGIWRFNLLNDTIKQLVIAVENQAMAADIGGLAVIKHEGYKYLMTSTANHQQLPIYRLSDYQYTGSVVVDGHAPDRTMSVAGFDVNQLLATANYPQGALVIHGMKNSQPTAAQNFKFVDLQNILTQL